MCYLLSLNVSANSECTGRKESKCPFMTVPEAWLSSRKSREWKSKKIRIQEHDYRHLVLIAGGKWVLGSGNTFNIYERIL